MSRHPSPEEHAGRKNWTTSNQPRSWSVPARGLLVRRFVRDLLLVSIAAGLALVWGPPLMASEDWLFTDSALGWAVFLGVLIGYVVFLCLMIMRWRRLGARAAATGGRVCADCGYDLSGLAEQGECPECARPYIIADVQRYWRNS